MVVTDAAADGTERRSEAVLWLLLAVAGLGAAATGSSVCFNHSPGKNVAEIGTQHCAIGTQHCATTATRATVIGKVVLNEKPNHIPPRNKLS